MEPQLRFLLLCAFDICFALHFFVSVSESLRVLRMIVCSKQGNVAGGGHFSQVNPLFRQSNCVELVKMMWPYSPQLGCGESSHVYFLLIATILYMILNLRLLFRHERHFVMLAVI